MKTIICSLHAKLVTAWLLFLLTGSTALAQGAAFTYQGRLLDNSGPANGIYDIRAALYTTNTGGAAFAGPITNSAVAVSNGLFVANLDFGKVFDGTSFWLEISVRTNGGGGFTILAPRQQLTPSPYAIYAEGANAAGLYGSLSGAALAGTYSNAVSFNNGANTFDGTFVGQFFGPTFIGGSFSGSHFGDGSGLYNLNPAQLTGTVPDSKLAANIARTNQVWLLNGNVGTTPGLNFVGTTDNQPLELRVSNVRAFRLEPTTDGTPNVIGGYSNNFVSPGLADATIAGGGRNGFTNRITGFGYGGSIGGGNNNAVNSFSGTVSGGANNTAYENATTVSGGSENFAGGDHDTIGGGQYNFTSGDHALIEGGFLNTNYGPFAAIGGGFSNLVLGTYNTIGGGFGNVTGGTNFNVFQATVGGGAQNIASGISSTIGGGAQNLAYNNDAAIAGGFRNRANFRSAVAGGEQNLADGVEVGIGSGFNNIIQTNIFYSFIGGGYQNTMQGGSFQGAVISGGANNSAGGSFATIAGGDQNLAVNNAFAAGHRAKAGQTGSFVWADSTEADFAATTNNQFSVRASGGVVFATGGAGITVDGQIVAAATSLTNFWQLNGNSGSSPANGNFLGTTDNQPLELHVKGQRALRLEPDNSGPGAPNVIGGTNFAGSSAFGVVVGGGYLNTNNGNYSVIGGGNQNQISPVAANAVIAGGTGNQILAGNFSTIGGGINNTNVAPFATIPGGVGNTAGANAFAAGSGALAGNQGSFVWADASSANSLASTNSNSVTMRADGGYRLYSNAGATLGVFLGHNGVSWATISDRNAKTNFAPVDYENVLDGLARVPIQRWNYKWEPEGTPAHIGPMAQDFKPAFYPGADDKSISTLEFDGVELAAIQGLTQKLKEKDERISALEVRIERLERLVKTVAREDAKRDALPGSTVPDKMPRLAGD